MSNWCPVKTIAERVREILRVYTQRISAQAMHLIAQEKNIVRFSQNKTIIEGGQ